MANGRVVVRGVLLSMLGVAVVGSTLAIAQRGGVGGDYGFFDPVIDVKAAISQRYVDQPDEEALQAGAINGMIEALGDPYTVYVPPGERQAFTKQLTGEFVGIGASVLVKDGWLTIVTPLEGSPALAAGIMPEDRVVEVEGQSTFGKTVEECVELLTGQPGTPVRLTVEREGEKLDPITIVRRRIIARTVEGFHRNAAEGGRWNYLIDPARSIAYMRLTQFTPTSSAELVEALDSLGAPSGGLRGLVLDLRGNPGGMLSEAIALADLFLQEGVIVSTKGRTQPEEIARAERPGTLPDFPLAILLNGQSASASEVLAGALVENGRAIIVGTRSFGKGSVQSVMNLRSSNGGQLKITEQFYYLPSGRLLHRKDDAAEWGVDPSPGFYVPMTDEETIAAIRVRLDEEVIRTPPPPAPLSATTGDGLDVEGWSNPDWILERLKDKQLAAAVLAVQGKVETGEWTPTGEEGIAGGTLALGELQNSEKLRERLLRELDRVDRRIEALETAAGPESEAAEVDLWADSTDLTGGTLRVLDKDGNAVATLKITGNTLEQWLVDADVEPIKLVAPEPATDGPQ